MPAILGDIVERQKIAPVIGTDPAYMRKLEQSIRWGEGIERHIEPIMVKPEPETVPKCAPMYQVEENEGEEIFTEEEQVDLENDIKSYLAQERYRWEHGHGEQRFAECREENREDGNVKGEGIGQKLFTLPMEVWAEMETNPDFNWGDKNDVKWMMRKHSSLKCEGNRM